jgi:predicted nucleotidyltransferase
MKSNLSHLPTSKEKELELITQTIRNSCDDVEKIILFGSYARGDYKEKKDLKKGMKSGHISDYDLLVVTQKKTTVDQFTFWKEGEKLNLSALVRIIACDIQNLNINLAEGQYLFTDIKKEGIILFDSKKYKLANKRRLKPEEKQRIARDYFEHWFKTSEMFFKGFKDDLKQSIKDKKYLSRAAFELHQSAEHSYKTILLVFTNYNPQEHYLAILGKMAAKHCPLISTLFPNKTQKDNDRFKLLEYAYIGGRYDPEYRISKEDLETLAIDVKKLLTVTKKLCEERINQIYSD